MAVNVWKLSLLLFIDTTSPAVQSTDKVKRFGQIIFWLSQYLIGSIYLEPQKIRDDFGRWIPLTDMLPYKQSLARPCLKQLLCQLCDFLVAIHGFSLNAPCTGVARPITMLQ